MAERSGFYPSNETLGIKNEYSGYEFGNVYKHIISNGVFATQQGTPSNYLQVLASSGLAVNVLPGAGIFANQWYENTANITFNIDSEASLNRIDLIVIEANKSPDVLKTYARVIKGTPAAVPVAPTPIDSDVVKQYPLARIYVTGGVSTITQSSITDLRGVAPTLWITSIIKQVDTSTLWNQFNDAFWTWFDNVKETLVSSTLMRKYTGYVNTTTENQKDITVPISQYNSVLDILQVHIEGRILREGVDYEKNGLTGIKLTNALPVVDTLVYFEIFKSVDGSDAESVADLLYQLEDRLGASIITADNGSDKLTIVGNFGTEILNKGVGFHTLYVPSTITGLPVSGKVWRGWSSFTSATKGYVLIISEDGDVYTIMYNNAWQVWRCLYQHNVAMLYTSSGNVFNASNVTTLTKALSNCANGWCLHFAKIGSPSDMNFHYHIPKVRYDGTKWSGQAICIEIPYEFSADGNTRNTCMKKLFITDNTITGYAGNALGVNANIGLVGITEY